MNISTSQCKETKNPIIHPAQCGTRHRTSVFASFSLTQFSFSRPVPRCLNSKCICAHLCTHGHAGLKNKVCSGALLAYCYFEELKIDCAIDQLKPSLKSMVQYYFCYKVVSALVENAPLGGSTMLVHFAYYTLIICSITQTCQILKVKGLHCKIILLCRLHTYKKYDTRHNR